MPAELDEMDITGLIMKTLFYLVYDPNASRNRGKGNLATSASSSKNKYIFLFMRLFLFQ